MTAGQRHMQWQMVLPPEVLEVFLEMKLYKPVLALSVNGRPLEVGDGPLESVHLNLNGRTEEGYIFDMIVQGEGAIPLTMQDHIPTLPAVPGMEIQPRPDWMIPSPWQNISDSSLVTHTVILD
jgi:hypothetical protein